MRLAAFAGLDRRRRGHTRLLVEAMSAGPDPREETRIMQELQ